MITGMGVVSCFGNDTDTFYDRYAHHFHLTVGMFICWVVEGRDGFTTSVLSSVNCTCAACWLANLGFKKLSVSMHPPSLHALLHKSKGLILKGANRYGLWHAGYCIVFELLVTEG